MTPRGTMSALTFLLWAALCPAHAAQDVSHPFQGVTHVVRRQTQPRCLLMHAVTVDLAAPGVRFLVTPPGGPKETIKQTTLQFLTEQRAQIAVNAHFFEPWPPPSPDDGSADLVGIAASNGRVYSPFDGSPPKQYAIHPNAGPEPRRGQPRHHRPPQRRRPLGAYRGRAR
jgi:hypothetical protein